MALLTGSQALLLLFNNINQVKAGTRIRRTKCINDEEDHIKPCGSRKDT